MDALMSQGELLALAQEFGLKLVLALATFLVGRWVAKLIIKGMRGALGRSKIDATLIGFLATVAYVLMIAVVVIAALGQLGIPTTSAAALLGGAGVAVGLSLKDQLSSFAAGVMLMVFRPFKQGDFVNAGGVSGTVEEVRVIATIMRSLDNEEVTVPNNQIWGDTITNYSARATRRIDLKIGISYDADIDTAKRIARELCEGDERVLSEPALWIGVTELGDSAVNLIVRVWCDAANFWPMKFDMTKAFKENLDKAGVSIPYPQTDVHVHQIEPKKPAAPARRKSAGASAAPKPPAEDA